MLEENAEVISVTEEEVWVETQLRSSCSHCSVGHCSTSVIAQLFRIRRNRFRITPVQGLKPGDRVVIGLPEEILVKASLLAYLLPLVVMILLVMVSRLLGYGESAQAIIALTGLLSGFYLMQHIGLRMGEKSQWIPHLVRRLDTVARYPVDTVSKLNSERMKRHIDEELNHD